MDAKRATTILVGIRLAVGAASWVSPTATGKLFGLDTVANPQAPYLARLFGARDVALGWGVIASEGSAREKWVIAGIGCDVADALAGIAGGRDGSLSPATCALVTATALNGAYLGATALRGS